MADLFLVTGGAGFIGSHLVERLLADGARVRVLDNFSTGTRVNLPFARAAGRRLEVIRGDLRNRAVVARAARGVRVIFHQAAMRSVPRSVKDPLGANENNVTGTLNVLEAARRGRVARVVYASSSSVYGDRPDLPKHEEQPPAPISPYAVSKAAGEQYAVVWTRLYGVETIGLRYFNVFGPRQDPKSEYAAVIPRFILWGLRGQPLQVHGDGAQSRDFTYIDNVVEANLLADRKSTRLNSSHGYISYAVFCLKKKNHTAAVRVRRECRLLATRAVAVDVTAQDDPAARLRRSYSELGMEAAGPVLAADRNVQPV